VTPGLVLYTPNDGNEPDGLTIVDGDGEPVWVHRTPAAAVNLRVSTYLGRPVLTWWEGDITPKGLGSGEFVIVDQTYSEVARVKAVGGLPGDLHEFILTPQGTALFLVTRSVPIAAAGWSPPPLPSTGAVASPSPAASASPAPALKQTTAIIEAIIQEVDVATGELRFEWHTLDHISPDESQQEVPMDGTDYDYVHANSIDLASDGTLLLSCRHTWCVYKIDRSSGDVVWRVGGKNSNFAMGDGAQFAWQHDAREHADGTISVFDNGSEGHPTSIHTQSRGLVLGLDFAAKQATVLKQFVHPLGLLSGSQGNCELLPNGGAFIGWGQAAYFSEFDATGKLCMDASFPVAKQSYRSVKAAWSGYPQDSPAMVLTPAADGSTTTLSVSWNGATDVAFWEVLGGDTPEKLRGIQRTPRIGFETAIVVPSPPAYVAVRALDEEGIELGRSGSLARTA
jgi:hypothetical protein